MKLVTLSILLLLLSCQDFNSNSSDRERYGSTTLDESDPNFAQAYGILQRDCMSCHTNGNYHSQWSSYTSSEAWVESGLIIRGDSANSEIIKSTINAGGTMPKFGGRLSDADFAHLSKWIDEIP